MVKVLTILVGGIVTVWLATHIMAIELAAIIVIPLQILAWLDWK
jgi:hypothetical protein